MFCLTTKMLFSLLLLSRSLLQRLNRLFRNSFTVCYWRYRVALFLIVFYRLSGWRILTSFSCVSSTSSSQSFNFLINNFGVIIVLSPDSLLLSFLKAAYLDSNTLQSIYLIFDILGKVIIFILNCLLFLHLQLLYSCHSSLVNIQIRLGC